MSDECTGVPIKVDSAWWSVCDNVSLYSGFGGDLGFSNTCIRGLDLGK